MGAFILPAILALAALGATAPASAQSPEDEAAVGAVIADWYARVSTPEAYAPWSLLAPAGLDAGPRHDARCGAACDPVAGAKKASKW